MVAGRGALAVLFGLVVLFWPRLELNVLVGLFGVYLCVDGLGTLAAVFSRSTAGPLEWWPVALEGAVGVVVGATALVFPLVPHRLIEIIAIWALVTGVLEILPGRAPAP